jgi:hypothetical protein
MQPVFVQDINQQMGIGGVTGFGQSSDFLGGNPSGFLSGLTMKPMDVNMVGAQANVFDPITSGFSGILNGLGGLFGGTGGASGIGSLVGSIGSLIGGGSSGSFGGILQMGMSLLGGLFSTGGIVGRDGTPFEIRNYADGGLIKAIAREKQMNGGRPAIPAVLTEGERVLTVEQNKRFEQLGGERILNFASGGIVGGQSPQFTNIGGSSSVTVNSPVTVQTDGGDGGVDAPRFKAVHEAMTRRLIQQEMRPGGSLRQKR